MRRFDAKEDGLVVSAFFCRDFDYLPAAEIKMNINDPLLREAAERYPGREFQISDREHPDPILRKHGDRYRCIFLGGRIALSCQSHG